MGNPVQILWGKQDQWRPITQGETLASLLTNGRLTLVAGTGHLILEEAIIAAMFS